MNIAFIPVRGGSKSIPLKNIKELCGKPLVYWTAIAANDAACIDKVIIATDNPDIKRIVLSFNLSKIEVYDREDENAQDTSSTESVMLEYIRKSSLYKDDYFFLIQATSPLLQSVHIEEMFAKMKKENAESALSCVQNKRFYWSADGKALNYDYKNRPRRQDFDGMYMENGACYINTTGNILRYENRLSGKICAYEMPEYTAIEIDEPDDWIMLENMVRKYHFGKDKKKYKMFLTDCDGVLTDGGMYYDSSGEVLKKFNTKDGMGFQLLKEAGFITGIITGENSETVKRRAEKLKIDEIHIGIKDKLSVVRALSEKYQISLSQIVYVGDDINDLDVIKTVGLGCCVNDAVASVKKHAKYVSPCNGGQAAVRDVIEYINKL